jgi:calmodulin
MKEAFNLFDLDKSGAISIKELTSVMFALGHNMTAYEVQKLMAEVDKNGDGQIDFEEFCGMMMTQAKQGKMLTEEEELLRAFKLFDLDGDGTITSSELRKMMKNLGADLTDEEVELLIKEADYDGDGTLDLNEFTTFMMTK